MQTTSLQKKEQKDNFVRKSVLGKMSGVELENEIGTEAGVPIFLQRCVASPQENPYLLQRQTDEAEDDFFQDHRQDGFEIEEDTEDIRVSPKLKIGSANDICEQEADAVAETVMRVPAHGTLIQTEDDEEGLLNNQPESPVIQRYEVTSEEDEEENLQTKSVVQRKGAGDKNIPDSTKASALIQSPGQGSGVPSYIRQRLERVLNADLSDVKVHNHSHAHDAAASINAKAFTHQNHIYLGKGQSADDLGLMAHELTHATQQTGPDPWIRRHRVAPTPVVRRNATALFGNGTPTNPGMTLAEFNRYTRRQADWFVEPTLSAADRADLWSLVLRIAAGGHILAGAGDLRLASLRTLNATDWANLSAFGRACHSGSNTVRILPASLPSYTLAQRITLGTTIIGLEAIIAPAVLKLTVSEAQLLDIQSGGHLPALSHYWLTFQPHLQERYTPAAGARGPEFQRILDLLSGPGILPFISLLGRIRNLHRFSVPTLTALMTNFADTSRTRPVHLLLVSGHDAPGSFRANIPLVENLVVNSPNLVLVLEGQASLASITAQIPVIAATYGQADAGGTFRIAQAMISGHGETRMMELAGTGAPSVSSTAVTYPRDSLDLDSNNAASTALIDTLIRNLDPATARIVYTGCLVGSTAVPANTPAASIPGYFNNPARQNLVAYTETRGVAQGLSPGFARGARAATGTPAALMDAVGNLAIQYPFDPDAYGSALAYLATGHDPIGVFRAAVEVAATAGPVVAEMQLRVRGKRAVTAEWWDETTLSLVATALHGVGFASGVDIMRLNTLSNLAHIPFLARYNGFGISVSSFVSGVNNQGTLAGIFYNQLATRPTFKTPPDADARAMRLMVGQAWLAYGADRTNAIISYLDTTPLLTHNLIYDVLDTSAIASSSSTFFATGAALTPGRIRLALAWLRKDPSNFDVKAYLDAQVSIVAGTPTLSAAVRAQLNGTNEQDILRLLGRLTATTNVVIPGGTTVSLENANVQIGTGMNRVRVEPRPYIATVLPHALNVRRRPSMRGAAFAWLKQGDSANVMGFTHNWAAVDIRGQLGFVHRNFITSP